MTSSTKNIIADQLLLSLDQPDLKMDALWAKEAETRIDAYERGEIKAISIHEIFGKNIGRV